MSYFIFLFLVMMVLGFLGVASNPAPYFAALGLVLAAAGGCGVLAGYGGSFISLVLFLIYLGGMLVVFAYSAALAAEPYPESWGDWSVLGYVVGYIFLCILGIGLFYVEWFDCYCGIVDEYRDFSVLRGDFSGVSFIYYLGGGMLIVCGWALLLTLFVVLELTRGRSRGALRAI
uniref:NADH-ubiquinone oxidoreductase chain 6 n=2 Tax=Anguilla australis TaxID=7940 RepID=Q5N6Q9_ANGAU|nr:NADH dehydrogenase subunit 6 [Anguilla australis australis]YP_163853.1 NADH dehydrogenase subunit 6 [Anguilla australis schmidti]BAD77995.1 NADH dehydrogenase subunits 6 [Anguilla australis australis]BAD78008.1 NADH dehydrogenase subunits 6 [Anguilla australis schmidti]